MRAAAARLLIDKGPEAVTHRRVAVEAGVPIGSASYYFPGRDGLFQAAVEAAESLRVATARAYAERLTRRSRSARKTASHLVEALYAPHLEPDVVATRLAPMLEATRSRGTAPTMRASWPQLLDVFRTVLDKSGYSGVADEDVVLLRLTVDSGLLYATTAGAEDVLAYAVDQVARLLTRVVPRDEP
ncbi:hypothetical protein GCM10023169_22100 [Georgenia halophila]|uniref:HTH tetR-type domain-containing protein n=2 Tax=Georgenia halophila TaxID=620889 RepID=A0ABP8L9T7_9MICO